MIKQNNFIIGRLENLELQQVSTWWDCLFYFGVLSSVFIINDFIIFLGCLVFLIVILQFCEALNKRKIKQKYNEFKKQKTTKEI
jgi:hypothetical protein